MPASLVGASQSVGIPRRGTDAEGLRQLLDPPWPVGAAIFGAGQAVARDSGFRVRVPSAALRAVGPPPV
jgi:hypothetical protein